MKLVIAVGQVLSEKYKLVRLVGDGGMGSVYEAEHLLLGTRVAIKVLHPELARRQGLADRFMQEARVSAQIKSPHVVQVHDVDRTPQGEAFLVMELLSGEPLSARLDRERKLPDALACDLAIQILEALEAAHGLGAVHRDLKPENVFLTPGTDRPFVKVIDFGIAKLRTAGESVQKNLTQAGVMMGTAEYMAPEQAFSADKVDARADIYSVGVMLYEMLAGARPITGEDARVIAIKVERGEGVPLVHAAPGVRPELAGLVQRAIAAHPDLRFSSAADMRRALEAITSRRVPDGAQGSVMPSPPPANRGTAHLGGAYGAPVAQADAARREPAVHKSATQMAGPVDAALRADYGPSHHNGAGTSLGAPAATYGAYGGAGAPPPNYDYDREEPRKRSLAWLLVLPLLLGAAAVGAYVYYNNPTTPTPAPLTNTTWGAPSTPATPAAPTAPTTTAGGATTPATPLTTPPLSNPAVPVQPSHPAQPGSAQPAPSSSAPLGPPLVLPSGFPSAFPFPPASNMPPIMIPSTFPTIFPPFAPPQQPQQPQQAPVQPTQPQGPPL